MKVLHWEGNYCLDYEQFPAFWLRPLQSKKKSIKKNNKTILIFASL